MKICVHTLVKNEERYLWFAVTSVIDHVDKLLLWDTGSTDNTPMLIDELKKRYSNKISNKEIGAVTAASYTKARQKMLDETRADWVMILDGDEVWWDTPLKRTIDLIKTKGEGLDSVVSYYANPLGDIFHQQSKSNSNYEIDGIKGHLTIRFMNTGISGFHTAKPHGQHGYFDAQDTPVQSMDKKRRKHIQDIGYLHCTHLIRSKSRKYDIEAVKRKRKLKRQIGIDVDKDYYYPEAFFRQRPDFILSPWNILENEKKTVYYIFGLGSSIKRKFFKTKSTGY